MNRYLIFALGLLVVVVILAPSLDLFNGGGGGAPSANGGVVGPPVVATPGSPQIAGAPAPATPPVGGGTVIQRDGNGRFSIDAMVNDQPLRLLVDTGADGVALSESDAHSIGIEPDSALFTQTVTTASGQSAAARVRIERLELAGHDLGAVDALVVRGLGTSLLGQTVLRRVGTVTMTGDRMVIGN